MIHGFLALELVNNEATKILAFRKAAADIIFTKRQLASQGKETKLATVTYLGKKGYGFIRPTIPEDFQDCS